MDEPELAVQPIGGFNADEQEAVDRVRRRARTRKSPAEVSSPDGLAAKHTSRNYNFIRIVVANSKDIIAARQRTNGITRFVKIAALGQRLSVRGDTSRLKA